MENLETILESLHQIEAGLADAVPTDDTRQVVASTSQKHVSKQGQDPSTKIKTKTHKVKKDVLETIQNQNTSLSGTISTPVHIAGRTLTHEEQNAREKVNFLIRILQENIDDSSTLVEKEQQWLEGPESKNDIILEKKIDLLNLHRIEIIDATSRFQQSMENFIQLIGKNIPSSYENINGDDIDVVMEKCNVMKRKILLASEEVVETIENLIRTMTNFRSTDADTNIAPADTDVPPGSGSVDADEEIEPADDGVHDPNADAGPVYIEPLDPFTDPPVDRPEENTEVEDPKAVTLLNLASVHFMHFERIRAWFGLQTSEYEDSLKDCIVAFNYFVVLEQVTSNALLIEREDIKYLEQIGFILVAKTEQIMQWKGYMHDIDNYTEQMKTECENFDRVYGSKNDRLSPWKTEYFKDSEISVLMDDVKDSMQTWVSKMQGSSRLCLQTNLQILNPHKRHEDHALQLYEEHLTENKKELYDLTMTHKKDLTVSLRRFSELKSSGSSEAERAYNVTTQIYNAMIPDFMYRKIDGLLRQLESKLRVPNTHAHAPTRPEHDPSYFHTQLVAFTQALLAAAYPPAPAASFDARPPSVTKRSVAAPFSSAACPALHALCARVAHITGVARTHPKIAAARFALEIAERAALVRVALAQARAVLSAAPPSTRVVLNERFAALNGCLAEASIRRVLVAANATSASAKHHGHGSEHTRSSSRKQKHSDDEQERFTDKSGTKVKTEKLYADGKQIHYVTATHAPAHIMPPAFGDAADMTNFMRSFERELDEAASGSEITNSSRAKK